MVTISEPAVDPSNAYLQQDIRRRSTEEINKKGGNNTDSTDISDDENALEDEEVEEKPSLISLPLNDLYQVTKFAVLRGDSRLKEAIVIHSSILTP